MLAGKKTIRKRYKKIGFQKDIRYVTQIGRNNQSTKTTNDHVCTVRCSRAREAQTFKAITKDTSAIPNFSPLPVIERKKWYKAFAVGRCTQSSCPLFLNRTNHNRGALRTAMTEKR